MADRAPTLAEALAQSTSRKPAPSLGSLLSESEAEREAFAGFSADATREATGGGRSVASRLTDPLSDGERRQLARDRKADETARNRPIETDGTLDRAGVKFWQRVRGIGAGGGRALGAALTELGVDPDSDVASWLRERSVSGETYAGRPVEGEQTWQELKAKPTVRGLAKFVIENGASSLADMGVLASGAGIAPYIASQSGSIGQQRAVNNADETATATGADVLKAMPAATASAVLERLGIHGIFGATARTVVGRIAQAGLTEALTEAIQSPIEYAGSNLGTEAGFDVAEAADQAVAGAVAGGFMGAGIRGSIEAPGAAARLLRRKPGRSLAAQGPNRAGSADAIDPDLGPNTDYLADTATGSVKRFDTARQAGLYATSNKVADRYNVVATPDGGFALKAAPNAANIPGAVEQAEAEAANLSQEDLDSPIPNDTIIAGREELARATASQSLQETLRAAGLPPIGARVTVDMGNGRTARGTMADVFEHSDPDLGAEQGARVALDDGTTFEEFLSAMTRGGMSIAELPDISVDEIAAGARRRLEAAQASIEVAPVPVPDAAPAPAPARATAAAPRGDMAGFMARVGRAESPNDTAKNPNSSATGRYQFTEGTWLKTYKETFGATGESDAQILAKRTDGATQDRVMQTFTAANDAALRKGGFALTDGNRYLAHFLGAGGARSILSAEPGKSAESILPAKVIAANQSVLAGKSASEVIAWAAKKMGGPAPAARPVEAAAAEIEPEGAAPARAEDAAGEEEGTAARIERVTGTKIGGEAAPTESSPTADASPPARVGASVVQLTDKSVVVRNTTPEQDAAIARALPAAVKPLENKKAGGMVYAAKHAAKIRAAIEGAPASAPALPVQNGQRIAVTGKDGSERVYEARNVSPTTMTLSPTSADTIATTVDTRKLGEFIQRGEARVLSADEPLPSPPAPATIGPAFQASSPSLARPAPAAPGAPSPNEGTYDDWKAEGARLGANAADSNAFAVAYASARQGMRNEMAGDFPSLSPARNRTRKSYLEGFKAGLADRGKPMATPPSSTPADDSAATAKPDAKPGTKPPRLVEGMTVRFDRDISYASADTDYEVERVDKSGRVYIRNRATGSGTSLAPYEIANAARSGAKIDARPAEVQTKPSAPAPTQQAARDSSSGGEGASGSAARNGEGDGQPSPGRRSDETGAGAATDATRPAYGADNKLVSRDRADELRRRLREKMGQINSGIDPEALALFTELGAFHIEAGARRFADFAKAIVADLGIAWDKARPYLRSAYNGARDLMEDSGIGVAGMDSPDQVRIEMAAMFREGGIATAQRGEEASDGLQDGLRAGDARPSAEAVQQPAEDRGAGRAGAEGERAGAPDARRDDQRPAEAAERPAPRPSRDEGRGAAGNVDADRVPARGRDAGRGRRADPGAADAQRVTGQNWAIEPGSLDEARSASVKARDNVAAIEIVKALDAAQRPATREEQAALAKYVGWGGLKNAFPRADNTFAAGFETIGPRLRELLTDEEYETARRSIQYAHYTSEKVVRPMWDAARRLGFEGGKVFEPGMGTGNFLGMMPADLAALSQYQGIEYDGITSRIAALLYPQSGVRQADYTRMAMPADTFDLVIGNPPFSETVIRSDPAYKEKGFVLHDFFFAKSLDAVRPGGLLMFVTSAGTMNKSGAKAREYLADRADLVGSVRLPGNAFAENAGTSVTTDIVVLRKRLPGEQAGSRDWTDTVNRELVNREGAPTVVSVSRYFTENPAMVLGEEGAFDKLVSGDRYAVRARAGSDLTADLARALDTLPANVMAPWSSASGATDVDFLSTERKTGSFYIGDDGRLMQQRGTGGVAVQNRGKGVEGGIPAKDQERIRALIPVRDALREVYGHDMAGNTSAGDAARARLNTAYEAFVAAHGPINKATITYQRPSIIQQETARAAAREEARLAGGFFDEGTFDATEMRDRNARSSEIAQARKAAREAAAALGREFDEGDFDPAEMPDNVIIKRPNIDPFMDDQEAYRLRAIEHYNDDTGEAHKSAVFFENVVTKDRVPEINSAGDAFLYVLNRTGRVDLDEIAQRAGVSRSDILDQLGDTIFEVPGTGGQWQTREQYLSGNVRQKLAVAREEARRDPSLERNVTALEAAQPVDLSPAEISANLGMPWIPTDVIDLFGREVLGLNALTVRYLPKLAQWQVEGDRYSAASTTTWGTSGRSAPLLISDALNRTDPKITKTVIGPDGREKQEIDPVATQAAQDKVREIKQAFSDWVWKDADRADELAGIYNRDFNNLIAPEYDGSYLTTPGISSAWSWRPHQKRVVARIIQSGNTYMAHAVGAGKTSAMIGAGMEMRRLGLVRKPAYVVPNHMLGQFTKEFYEQYPTAKIAVADERQFHTDRRKQFVANIAGEDLDAVIITHSAFGYIPISDAFSDGLIEQQIEDYRGLVAEIKQAGGGDRFTQRRIEQAVEALEQKLQGRTNGKRKDQVFTFEETGIDFLFVDEAHLFRKLDFATKMGSVRGVDPNGSQMAFDLFAKTRYLETRTPGRSHVLASGTPITNTMAELFSLSRYVQPQALEERGIAHFDAWAGAYGDTVTALEQDPAGGYKPQTRFAKFVNVPELSAMVRQVMDVVTSKQLEQYVTRPKLKNGRRELVAVDASAELVEYQEALKRRMVAIQNRSGPPKKGDDILLSVIGDGRKAAIDMRLVDAGIASNEKSKLDVMIDRVVAIGEASKRQPFHKPESAGYSEKPVDYGPATQMIFSDLGINGDFPIHKYIANELQRRGFSRGEVAIISDYKTHVARQRLFNDMNEGKVRVLIGSVAKMGTGVNAQRRLLALHNMDPQWYPANDEQRNGRALRQGNMNPEIEIIDYSTVGTYDSTMWGLMETKARFIEGFMAGDPSIRSMDDLGEASQYEQAKALTTSDPRILKLTEMRQDLEKAERRADAFDREQYAVRRRIDNARSMIERAERRIPEIEADIAQRRDIAGDAFTGSVMGQEFNDRAEWGAAVLERMEAIAANGVSARDARVGEVGGFRLVADAMRLDGKVAVRLYLNRNGDGEQVAIASGTAAGISSSVANAIRKFDGELEAQRDRIVSSNREIEEFTPQLARTFDGMAEISDLASRIERLEGEIAADSAKDRATVAPEPAATMPVVRGDLELRAALYNSRAAIYRGVSYTITGGKENGYIAYADGVAIGSNGQLEPSTNAVAELGYAVNRAARHGETLPEPPKDSRFGDDAAAQFGEAMDGALDAAQQDAIRSALQDRLAALGIADRVSLNAATDLFAARGTAGSYGRRLIKVALDSTLDPSHVLDHEAIHAIRDLGLFTRDEWSMMARAAATDPVLMADIRTRYPELDREGQEEEAVAELFARYRAEKKAPNGTIARAFERLLSFVRALSEALSGIYGTRRAGEAVLDAVASGEVGARAQSGDPRITVISAPKFARSSEHAFAPEIEERFEEARKGIADQRGLVDRVTEWSRGIAEGFTRHFAALPNTAEYSDLRQQLRKLEAAPQASRERVVRVLSRMVEGMSKSDYDLFSRKVILDDLSFEADEGRDLPFGFTPDTLAAEKARIDSAALGNDTVTNAIRQRKLTNDRLADEMVAAGILSKEQVKNPSYYRHQVLEYARLQQAVARTGNAASRLRSPRWARRKGSVLDINANLLEAEFDWMQKAFTDIETAKAIDWVKRSTHNVRGDLIRQANETNRQNVDEAVAADLQANGPHGKIVAAHKAFRQRIAIGISTIRAALEDGTINDVPAGLEGAADAIVTGRRGGEPPFALLSWMLDNNKPGALGAASVLKAVGERRAWTKALLGDRYLDPMNIESLVKRIGPADHVTWQPDEGKLLFTAKTIPEHIIDGMIAKLTASPGVDGAVFAETLAKARSAIVVGGDKYQMVLPREVADTLNQLRDPQTQGILDEAVQIPLRAWKRWVLINPRRVIKYNINNLSGDLDAVIAGNPRLLMQVGQAAKELASVMRGKAQPSARYQEAIDRGVFDSGLSIQEIPEINSLSAFTRLTEQPSLAKSARLPFAKAWGALQGFTQWRENVFRYAAYLNYVERLEKGEDMKTVGYGASIPAMVDAVADTKDRAALLARDLVGDYGDVSATGRYLRSRLLPFYSWLEVNTRRYWRLSRNAYGQGIGRGVAVSGGLALAAGARRSAWLAIRMGMFFAAVSAWNLLFHGDEEDKLSDEQRRQMHLILGTWDGEIVTLRTQGALSDALSWFGYADVAGAMHEIEAGRAGYLDAVKAMAKAPINKVVGGLTPLLSQPIAAATGKSLWPDAFNPRPIRDGWRNFFSTFSMENEYDAAQGKPTRGYLRSFIDGVTYSRDPGEIAYDEARGLAYDWLKRVKGQEGGGATTTPRSDALYDYRRALRYGDDDAADQAMDRMGELGMTQGDLAGSIKRAAPLGPIAKKDRTEFVDSLTDEEFAKLQAAQEWYEKVYR